MFRRRTLRSLAGFAAAILLAGQALAASGLCLVTLQDAPPAVHETSAGCAEHQPADPASGVKHHCPAEDPSPQARSVDLPTPQPVAAVAPLIFDVISPVDDRPSQVVAGYEVPPPPLYARLQRLRL